jgi:hypothetical protein
MLAAQSFQIESIDAARTSQVGKVCATLRQIGHEQIASDAGFFPICL